MRINIDKEYLQKITKGAHEFIASEDQRYEMERINGMIMQDIHFCSLVTGYRGTGKSAYVKYVLEKLQKEECNVAVISFNAAKYKSYEVFIKRFIRELYFQLDAKEKVSKQLRKMYYHTFFDIKETYLNNSYMVEKEIVEDETEDKVGLKSNINIIKAFKIGIYILLGILIWNNMDLAIIKFVSMIPIGVGIVAEFVDVNLIIENLIRKKDAISSEETKKEEYNRFAESLYDGEIVEYYVYNEIKNIAKEINLIFVLDELDKVGDNELDMIFHDLKPLLLSEHCNFILIAGRNMDKYLKLQQNDADSIPSTIFSNKIYMQLSTVQEMRDFAMNFYQGKNSANKEPEFYLDCDAQNYFNLKIFEAKGVKRAFVNGILSDLRWDNGNPYIDMSSKVITKEFMLLFNVLEEMEEYVCQNYVREKRDESLQNVYYWIEKIQQKRHTTFSKTDIIGEAPQLAKNVIYLNLAEQVNIFDTLIETMMKLNILEPVDGAYKWCSDIMINIDYPEADAEADNSEQFGVIKEYIEMFLAQWDEIGKMLSCFAKYNGLDFDSEENYLKYRDILNKMIPNFEIMECELKDTLFYLEELSQHGIEQGNLEDIQKYSVRMRTVKGWLVEKLLEYTCKRKMGTTGLRVGGSRNPFDILYTGRSFDKSIFIEIKYYKEYLKIINSALLYKLLGKISNYRNIHNLGNYVLKLVVFADSVDDEGMNRFNEKENLQIILVPFNNYDVFRIQMNLLCE